MVGLHDLHRSLLTPAILWNFSLLLLTQDKAFFLVCKEVTASLKTSQNPCLCNKNMWNSDYLQAALGSYSAYWQKQVFRCLLIPGQRVCYLRKKKREKIYWLMPHNGEGLHLGCCLLACKTVKLCWFLDFVPLLFFFIGQIRAWLRGFHWDGCDLPCSKLTWRWKIACMPAF